MNPKKIKKLLEDIKGSKVSVSEALTALKGMPYEELDNTVLDTHRSLRKGFPEVIYGEGKTTEQIKAVVRAMASRKENCLVTRMDEKKAKALKKTFPAATYCKVSKTFFMKSHKIEASGKGVIMVISAGTSDVPVAEEAALVAEYMGNTVRRLYDVGVAGIHRLLCKKDDLWAANVLIVVAGMEGALPSVVAGLVSRPVIAVPTSVGYGANLGGLTTLMAMLNSCACGITVVNIDNGFGAAYAASLINREQS
ncbi:MAG: 1-(5-phosphoribosyl)-5-amino-4-imidazole-carboxylate carboxylase [Deltaproteobacteria bacterium RIFCSPLOWO2_02_FULL_53_8]|nr:MAG: 1-(5-phosphoribosyl)-5-amino-4-imidazole-carboxylate carboxylase [Deltaproteobacteria bacterium RIFCSPLOWO2_02_FULL_53_8]